LESEPIFVVIRKAFLQLAPNNVILQTLYREFQIYKDRQGSDFGDEAFIHLGKQLHPLIWWSLVSKCINLKEIASRLFRMPASAAGGILTYLLVVVFILLIHRRA
jgi:hypothetical protein